MTHETIRRTIRAVLTGYALDTATTDLSIASLVSVLWLNYDDSGIYTYLSEQLQLPLISVFMHYRTGIQYTGVCL